MTIRKPNRVTTDRSAVIGGRHAQHRTMPKLRGRWAGQGLHARPRARHAQV
jgi:hypothetical protein